MNNEMLSLQINSRIDSKSSLYFTICKESYRDFMDYEHKLKILPGLGGPLSKGAKYFEYAALFHANRVKAIIFGALCLEAFIYDYASHKISDNYTREYLDKLDLRAKWVIIPKLVTGKEFPRDSQAFEHLGKLKKARNDLVHAKSKPIPRDDKEWAELFERKTGDIEVAELNPYETVIEVLTEFRNLDETTEDKWWELTKYRDWADYMRY
jgi:hypothetical protein